MKINLKAFSIVILHGRIFRPYYLEPQTGKTHSSICVSSEKNGYCNASDLNPQTGTVRNAIFFDSIINGIVCADCGNNLHFHFNQGNPEIKYFNCSNYKGNRGTCTSTHYVRVDFLEQVVLGEIKRLTKFASRYEDDFVKAVMGSTQQNVALDRRLKEKELAALQARDEERDGLFERIYEDNVSGKLSDDRFAKMSRRYEDEQKEISEKIKTLRAEMDKLSSKSITADMFISTVCKYTRAKTLTPRMLNELIDHIEVHQAEKIDGIWEQHLVIHYNGVGAIFIPDVFPLPAPQVSVNTRKGVVVNYAPCKLAV